MDISDKAGKPITLIERNRFFNSAIRSVTLGEVLRDKSYSEEALIKKLNSVKILGALDGVIFHTNSPKSVKIEGKNPRDGGYYLSSQSAKGDFVSITVDGTTVRLTAL
jgi:hypothetical protein